VARAGRERSGCRGAAPLVYRLDYVRSAEEEQEESIARHAHPAG